MIWHIYAYTHRPGNIGPLQELFAEWCTADEDWTKSALFIKISSATGHISSDSKGWLSIAEVQTKLGEAGAKSMIDYLEKNKPAQCRDHPDAPGVKDPLQNPNQNKFAPKHFQIQFLLVVFSKLHFHFPGVPTIQDPGEGRRRKSKGRLGDQGYGM